MLSSTAPLGEVAGPVRSVEGFHLVLVEERIGLIMHDGGMSRLASWWGQQDEIGRESCRLDSLCSD